MPIPISRRRSSRTRQQILGYTIGAIILLAGGLYWLSRGQEGGADQPLNIITPAASSSPPMMATSTETGEVNIEPTGDELPLIATSTTDTSSTPVTPAAGGTGGPRENILQTVPFTSQAPLGEWSDARQQDGCEEASALMAMAWVKGETGQTATQWRDKIVALADWQQANKGENLDVHVNDVADWIFRDYFSHDGVSVKDVSSAADIIAELEVGRVVLLPMDGQALGNPYFSPPGPERHMLLVIGYDYDSQEFITNDPGTRRGASFRYGAETLYRAIRVYPTGYHQPFGPRERQMVVVSR